MARQVLERLTKSPFLILLDLRLGQKLYFRMLFQCSVVFPSISFTIPLPSSLPTQTSKLENFPAKSNSKAKHLYPLHIEILETADLAGGGLLERLTQNLNGAHLRSAVDILVHDVQNH